MAPDTCPPCIITIRRIKKLLLFILFLFFVFWFLLPSISFDARQFLQMKDVKKQ